MLRVQVGQDESKLRAESHVERQTLAAREWVFARWPYEKRNAVLHAIQSSVVQELRQRDYRCYGIPLDGNILVVDSQTGRLTADVKLAELKQLGRCQTLETKRRWTAWMALKPDVAKCDKWLEIIEEDDGKDESGQWLCGEHHGRRYTRAQMSQDSSLVYETGFGVLPKWLTQPPLELCCHDEASTSE